MTREEMDAFCDKCPVRGRKINCHRAGKCASCKEQNECLPFCIYEELEKANKLKEAIEEVRARREAEEHKYD